VSFAALNWAYEQKCGSGIAKSVLVYLANCANLADGECYPSVATIVRNTEHTEDAVRKALARLVSKGLVEREHQFARHGGYNSTRYRLPVTSGVPQDFTGTPSPEFRGTPSPEFRGTPTPPYPENRTTPPPNSGEPPSPDSWVGVPLNSGENPLVDTQGVERYENEQTKEYVHSVNDDIKDAPADAVAVCASSVSKFEEDPEFAAWWKAYPRKSDKGHARRAWKTATKKADPATIMAGLRAYVFESDPQFWPLGATWLNGERWNDVPVAKPAIHPSQHTSRPVFNALGNRISYISGGL
jgi:hypothetical protein